MPDLTEREAAIQSTLIQLISANIKYIGAVRLANYFYWCSGGLANGRRHIEEHQLEEREQDIDIKRKEEIEREEEIDIKRKEELDIERKEEIDRAKDEYNDTVFYLKDELLNRLLSASDKYQQAKCVYEDKYKSATDEYSSKMASIQSIYTKACADAHSRYDETHQASETQSADFRDSALKAADRVRNDATLNCERQRQDISSDCISEFKCEITDTLLEISSQMDALFSEENTLEKLFKKLSPQVEALFSDDNPFEQLFAEIYSEIESFFPSDNPVKRSCAEILNTRPKEANMTSTNKTQRVLETKSQEIPSNCSRVFELEGGGSRSKIPSKMNGVYQEGRIPLDPKSLAYSQRLQFTQRTSLKGRRRQAPSEKKGRHIPEFCRSESEIEESSTRYVP